MPARILHYLGDHALAVAALICSLLALAGSSYAAFTISGSQIRNHSINPVKLNPRLIAGSVRAWAHVDANGHLIAGHSVRKVTEVIPGSYGIDWKTSASARCSTLASVDADARYATQVVNGTRFIAAYASALTGANVHRRPYPASTGVQTFNQQGVPTSLPFNVAVVC